MRFKSLLSVLLSVLLGATFGALIKIAYLLPKTHPTDGFYFFILETPLGQFAPSPFSGNEILIHIAIRAFTYSVLAGTIAGVILRKLKFPRVFCYSALWVPVADIALRHLVLYVASDLGPEQINLLQIRFAKEFWIDLCVYGWYYFALYVASLVIGHVTQQRNTPAQTDMQSI